MGQNADRIHLGLKLRMNGAVPHVSLNAFIVMIALKQIKHELFFLHVGCPISGKWLSWQEYFVVSLSLLAPELFFFNFSTHCI